MVAAAVEAGAGRVSGAEPSGHGAARLSLDSAALELTIESLAAGGDGVAHASDGRVVFVPFTAPGDRVRVRLEEVRARFARGRVEALLEAGPGRVSPPCPAFGRCGGCVWQHLAYPVQVDAKRRILRETLRHVAGLAPPAELPFFTSPAAYGYRGRARVCVEGGRVGYRRRRSRALYEVTRCPVLLPVLEAALARLAAKPPLRKGECELVAGADGSVRATPLPPRRSEAQPIALRVAGERFRVSPGVFIQSNALLLERLVSELLVAAGGGERLLELHAGAGFFTLPLARRFARVMAVDADRRAVADLRRNLADAGLRNVESLAAPAERALRSGRTARLSPEVVVLDPPRGGLGLRACALLARLPVTRVAYLSCDPATFARDLGALVKAGFVFRRLVAFDLFPQTAHIEALAVLERSAGKRGGPPRRARSEAKPSGVAG